MTRRRGNPSGLPSETLRARAASTTSPSTGKVHSLDPALQRLEDTVCHDIREIVQTRRIPSDPATRVRIAFFAAAQKVRTDAHRQQYRDLWTAFREVFERDCPNEVSLPVLSDQELYCEAIRSIPQLAKTAVPHLLDKAWILYGTTGRNHFHIGDNPVVMDNSQVENELISNIGLAVRGIEIYLPISESLCLGFLCRSNEALIREAFDRSKRVGLFSLADYNERLVKSLAGRRYSCSTKTMLRTIIHCR